VGAKRLKSAQGYPAGKELLALAKAGQTECGLAVSAPHLAVTVRVAGGRPSAVAVSVIPPGFPVGRRITWQTPW